MCTLVFLGICPFDKENASFKKGGNTLKKIIVLLLSLCFCLAFHQPALAKDPLAPEIKLKDMKGQEQLLKPPYDQPIVLNFWASWCGPCKQEAPELVMLSKKYEGKVKIYAVNLTAQDSEEGAYMFAKDYGFTFPVLLDKTGEAASLFRAAAVPTTYFINRDGEIVNVLMGYGGEGLLEKRINYLLEN